jgi:hypothetical protein
MSDPFAASGASGAGAAAERRHTEADLGKLVSMDKHRRPFRPKPAAGAEGEIVIFTGVRYERRDPLQPNNGPTPARPKRKRG